METKEHVIVNESVEEVEFDETDGDIAAALRAGMKCAGVTVLDIKGVPHAVQPHGVALIDMEKLLPNPKRIDGSVGLEEPDSFCTYFEDFREPHSRIYGFPDEHCMAAVFDENERGAPRWRAHKALLQLKLSPEWLAWMEAFKTTFVQMDLAEFLNDHMEQIAEPAAGELLSGISTINITNNWKCTSAQREGGDISFSYAKENTAQTATGKIPSRLTLSIAPFRSWHPVSMTVYLSYRLSGEKLTFSMRGHQVDELIAASYNDVRNYVQDKLKVKVLV